MKKTALKTKKHIEKNIIIYMYILGALLLEMSSVYIIEGTPFISTPWLELAILGIIVSVMIIVPNNIARGVIGVVFLIIEAVLDNALIIVFDMTGQYFDYGMLNLRNDAFGILESIPVNFISFYITLLVIIFYIIFSIRVIRKKNRLKVSAMWRATAVVVIVLMGAATGLVLNSYNAGSKDKYDKMVFNDAGSKYGCYGLIGNLENEMAKGIIFTEMKYNSDEEIENFIYSDLSETSEVYGVSEGNNVVVILSESLEWFPFIASDEYPNGLNLSEEDIEYLYPNLMRFYDESVVMTNFHSKEKTDISETLSVLGAYPTDAYVAYDFYDNTIPFSVPNTIKLTDGEDIQCKSFHNGTRDFYNRPSTHNAFGFESFTSSDEMLELSSQNGEATMYDYISEGERNLDSEMIDTCKDEMFPTDTRFFTYITSITMHGMYYERDNLQEYRDKLYSVCTPSDDEKEQMVVNYMTTVMEFDRAVGAMMDDLDSKGLLDNTTIVIFGDHNAYYQQMSNYVKDIYDYDTDRNYTDLYKIPLMVYDQNVEPQEIDKFTCTSDIVPTIFDLLGIRTFENMYYGNSVFCDKSSVLYSRAYNFFAGDGLVYRSLNDPLFVNEDVTEEYKSYFHSEGIDLVEEIRYCDQVFYQDYFADETHYNTYIEKLKQIQTE